LIHSAIAFFWALDPEALMEPATQSVLLEPLAEVPADEPPSEPQAASRNVPAMATAARRVFPVMYTLVLQEVRDSADVRDARKKG